MAVILSVKKERGKMRIAIAGCDEVLLPLSMYRQRPLQEGDDIDLEEFEHWVLLHQYRPALDRAVGLLAARAHSRKEIEDKLRRSCYHPSTIEMVLYKLEKEHLLDDADFARQWVEARLSRKLGRTRIAQELRRKGISADEAQAALEDVSDEDQLDAALSLAEKAAQRIKPGEDPRKSAQRIAGMLVRRGFNWDVARQAIDRVLKDIDE